MSESNDKSAPALPPDTIEEALAALHDAQTRLRALTETESVGIGFSDAEGRVLEVNDAFLKMVGYSLEDFTSGRVRWLDITPSEYLPLDLKAIEELRSTGRAEPITKEFIRKDGTRVPVLLSGRLLEGTDGKFACVAIDLTERRQAAQALQETQRQYSNLVESLPQLVWTTRADGVPDYVSQQWIHYTGSDLASTIELGWGFFLPVEDQHQAASAWQTAVETGGPYAVEYRLRARDGQFRWFLARGVPIKDAEGQITHWFGTCTDIHDQKLEAEERARLTEEVDSQRKRLDDLIGSVPGVVWEAWGQPDRDNQRIDFVSHHVEYMLGYTVQEWVSTPNFWLTIVHPEDRERAARSAMEAWTTGSQHINEFRWIRKDGQAIWCESHSVVTKDAAGAAIGMRGVTIDVSERKQLEVRLREETQTLETIHQFGQRLSAELDLERLLQAATDSATNLTGAQFGAFLYNVVNPAGESYMLYTISGVAREKFAQFPMPRKTDVFAPTFDGEAIVRVDDIRKDPRYGNNDPYNGMPPGHLPVASYLAVPVISRSGEVLGGLFFGHEQTGMFTERHEHIVGGLASQVAVAIDNARLFQAERERSEQLTTAVKEVHHRVKNSLQGVSALLEMQITPEATTLPVEVIQDSLNQIKTIALVHDLLAHDQPMGRVDVAQVLTNLVTMLTVTMATPEAPLPIRLETVSLRIPIRPAIALALVVNELVTNAAKHFITLSNEDSPSHDATIQISLHAQQEEVRLCVQDNGPGFPPGFDPVVDAHIGLELVQTLVSNDLHGSVSFHNGASPAHSDPLLAERGARVEVAFRPARLSD